MISGHAPDLPVKDLTELIYQTGKCLFCMGSTLMEQLQQFLI
jgi:hypothetical protein